ncbi:MAG: hypothetical protein ACE5G5_11795 [Candidatus Methylomirabilales bacterium]
MDRRAVLGTLLALSLVLVLALGCEIQERSAREGVQPAAGEAVGESFKEVILRIDGMT